MGGRLRRAGAWLRARAVLPLTALLVGLSATALLALEPTDGTRSLATLLAIAVVFGAAVVGYATLRGRTAPDDERIAPAPWTPEGAIVDVAPERTTDDPALAADALSVEIARAGRIARDRGTVADGLAAIRPTLQSVLIDALRRGSMDRAAAERSIEDGLWTDDRAAAATLSDDVRRPDWPLRERLRAWLFPERIVRREVQRAVHEIGRIADAEVPTVPGRRAPRTVPVVRPGLAELRRGADGDLQQAVDPLVDPAGQAGANDDSDDPVAGETAPDGGTTGRDEHPAEDES